MTTPISPRIGHGYRLLAVLSAYLALLSLAEVLTAFSVPQLGLILHGIILVMLIVHAAIIDSGPQHNILLTLTLAPLIRLVSLSLPLSNLSLVYWYAVIGLPLYIAAFVTTRASGLSFRDIGITANYFRSQLLFMVSGIGLGYMEYEILRPQPLVPVTSVSQLLLAAGILLIFTGFLEEFIFRGLMQRAFSDAAGWPGILYTAAVFAVLHLGYRSTVDFAFVFGVAVLFSFIVKRTGSILGVGLAHGMTNITLYLVFPVLLGHLGG